MRTKLLSTTAALAVAFGAAAFAQQPGEPGAMQSQQRPAASGQQNRAPAQTTGQAPASHLQLDRNRLSGGEPMPRAGSRNETTGQAAPDKDRSINADRDKANPSAHERGDAREQNGRSISHDDNRMAPDRNRNGHESSERSERNERNPAARQGERSPAAHAPRRAEEPRARTNRARGRTAKPMTATMIAIGPAAVP